MALEEYINKRRFDDTPEPEGTPDFTGGGRFVIQRHKASRLHYDLRLEMDGVLKSWAVPKGPSMNPKHKRLAVETEDHPVKYLSFEGVIPKGNYGAGEMRIWDEGTYTLADDEPIEKAAHHWHKGNIKILFSGKKIKGSFALVRTKKEGAQKTWLLIKKSDDYSTDMDYSAENFIDEPAVQKARNAKVRKLNPEEPIKPMLATPSKAAFDHHDWIFEAKWDGYRALTKIENGAVNLYSRNGISFTNTFPSLVNCLRQIGHDVILDGEITVVNKDGLPDFNLIKNFGQNKEEGELRYHVFDMLYLNGHDMTGLELINRKSLIPEVINNIDKLYYSDHIAQFGKAFFEKATAAGMEGMVAKKANSLYEPGLRTENWLKIKAFESLEAIICGYTESDKNTFFGSLILGIYQEDKLIYIGNCGTWFNSEEQRKLKSLMDPLERKTPPFEKKINLKGRKPVWISPELICEVRYSEKTAQGRLRHPSYKGLRTDKKIGQITDQNPVEAPADKVKSSDDLVEIEGIPVPITNLDKVYWPDSGLRKYDLIDYYIKISEFILPYLKDRPQNLHRHPNGIKEAGFYQKNMEDVPDWIAHYTHYSSSSEKEIAYMLCQNTATLIYMANLGCIEINPWNTRIGSIHEPDYTVIDLDPSDKTTFEEVIEVALAAKTILDKAGVAGYCKTSGSGGIHIYIPLGAKYSYDEARDFTKLICYYVRELLPGLTSMERAVKSRKGKLYLDYLQNRRGQTLAAPYCARPKPGATVSAPITWKELEKGIRPSDFHIQNMPARLTEKGDLFKPVLGEGLDMAIALQNLEAN